MIKLDDRDIKILSVLEREGRISKTELARRVSLSATPCWERLQRLEKAGLIAAYRAQIHLKKLAPHVEVFVMAELDNHRAETLQIFEKAVQRYDDIVSCWSLGGGFDYLLYIVSRDIDTYQRMIDTLLGDGVGLARYFTYIVTKPVKDGPLPLKALLASRSSE
ncbi:Lrp/AsnC family transcriptional regulator [Pseudohoeflea coraliihabitans]|uniref:Lrp/AsnC family transcriptional regulator n=1 Tax=Pseudohoeflea coraliihabitans TaxID=2860393 RepID=A0ABS6WK08_9HYPH|nr:Lrp/AsnC family transcriptional regulator [Pseudohoeflea sp. DP4N28-3]MBW3096205.1 Lrp/AsnC family transcriptional regulator [Pseudohoeflea sp. DP4N28-3]